MLIRHRLGDSLPISDADLCAPQLSVLSFFTADLNGRSKKARASSRPLNESEFRGGWNDTTEPALIRMQSCDRCVQSYDAIPGHWRMRCFVDMEWSSRMAQVEIADMSSAPSVSNSPSSVVPQIDGITDKVDGDNANRGLGLKQRIRDLQRTVETEVLTARKELAVLRGQEIGTEEREQSDRATLSEEEHQLVERVKQEVIENYDQFFDELESTFMRNQRSENERLLSQIEQLRADNASLQLMVVELSRAVSRLEDETKVGAYPRKINVTFESHERLSKRRGGCSQLLKFLTSIHQISVAATRHNGGRKKGFSGARWVNWRVYAAMMVLAAGIILGSWWANLRENAVESDARNPPNPDEVSREEILRWTNATARRIADDFTRGPLQSSRALLRTLQSDTFGGYVGARVRSLPSLGGNERGLFARKTFAEGHVVMRIPRTAWYSQDDIPTALASMIGTSRLQKVAPEVQRIGLGLGLLYEVTSLSSNETKGWLHNRLGKSRVADKELLKEWFSSFPDSFDSVVRFNPNQSALVFEPARGELRRLERFLVTCRSLATVMPTMFGIESMESAEAQLHVETLARWAWGIVLSRTGVARVREATGAERDLVLLLPGVSLVNTAMDDWNLQNPECDHQACSVRARRTIRKGEELTMDYGLKSNLQFLIFGGFTIQGNELGYPMRMNLTAKMGKDMPSECEAPFVIGLDSDWHRMLKCSRFAVSESEEQSWDSGELEHPPSELSSQEEQALGTIISNLQERVEEITRSLASVDIPAMEADNDPLSAKLVGVVRQELNAAIAWREKAEALMLSARRH